MSNRLYAVQEVQSRIVVRRIDPREAAAVFQRSGHVLLGTPADAEALASSRGELLRTLAPHAGDAPLGRARSHAGCTAA